MTWHLQPANERLYPALHSILVICGEHMYRTQGFAHWYPFRSLEANRALIDMRYLYAVYDSSATQAQLVGTFNLNPTPRTYYTPEIWADPTAPALYFGGLGILPAFQGTGLGRWCMQQADAITQRDGYRAIRFDAVAANAGLLAFYDRLGYERRAEVRPAKYGGAPLQCFEREFD